MREIKSEPHVQDCWRGLLEWLSFVALLVGWAVGLSAGLELYGAIHVLLLAAIYLLIRNISKTGLEDVSQRDHLTRL